MKLHLRLLRKAEELQEALENDGWNLQGETRELLCAKHPEVNDERTARVRLDRLGLLTSSSLAIEFSAR
jgi:hypothetical protein